MTLTFEMAGTLEKMCPYADAMLENMEGINPKQIVKEVKENRDFRRLNSIMIFDMLFQDAGEQGDFRAKVFKTMSVKLLLESITATFFVE